MSLQKEVRLDEVFYRPNNFKICKKCGKINDYDNKRCECNNTKFNRSEKAIMKAYNKELEFWMEEAYSEFEADSILIYV